MKYTEARAINEAVMSAHEDGMTISDAESVVGRERGLSRGEVREAVQFAWEVRQSGDPGELAFPRSE